MPYTEVITIPVNDRVKIQMTAPEYLTARKPIPLAIMQKQTCRLFYNRHSSPLDILVTLGSDDHLLPHAIATDLEKQGSPVVHEIGPGNHNIARRISGRLEREYHTYDFSDASYAFVKDDLPDNIHFHQMNVNKFPERMQDDPSHVLMVELLDDIATEFYWKEEGEYRRVAVTPRMKKTKPFPSWQNAARIFAGQGDFSKSVQRLANRKSKKENYKTKDIMRMIERRRWNQLEDVYPDFIALIDYPKREGMHYPLETMVSDYWSKADPEKREFIDEVIKFYKSQMDKAGEKVIVHLPVAGLNFMYAMKDRQTTIDIFDYGYTTPGEGFGFGVHAGQITASVNFQLLEHAAKVLGYRTEIQSIREYIQTHTKANSERLINVLSLLLNTGKVNEKNAVEFMFDNIVNNGIETFNFEETTKDNFMGMRISRSYAEALCNAAIDQGLLSEGTQVPEASFHLRMSTKFAVKPLSQTQQQP